MPLSSSSQANMAATVFNLYKASRKCDTNYEMYSGEIKENVEVFADALENRASEMLTTCETNADMKFQKIIDQIQKIAFDLNAKMDDVASKMEDRIIKMEDRIIKMEDRIIKMEDRIIKMEFHPGAYRRNKLIRENNKNILKSLHDRDDTALLWPWLEWGPNAGNVPEELLKVTVSKGLYTRVPQATLNMVATLYGKQFPQAQQTIQTNVLLADFHLFMTSE